MCGGGMSLFRFMSPAKNELHEPWEVVDGQILLSLFISLPVCDQYADHKHLDTLLPM